MQSQMYNTCVFYLEMKAFFLPQFNTYIHTYIHTYILYTQTRTYILDTQASIYTGCNKNSSYILNCYICGAIVFRQVVMKAPSS